MKIFDSKNLKGLIPILCTWLFSIYPVLVLYAFNCKELFIQQLLLPLLVSIVFSTIVFVLGMFLLKDKFKSSLATVILLLIFWNYGVIYTGINKLVGLQHWHLIPLLLFIYAHLVYLVVKIRQQKTLENANIILLIPISLLILFNVVTIVPGEWRKMESLKETRSILQAANAKATSNNSQPDIYFILLDECASIKTIKSEWGYDNAAFSNYLSGMGFYIAGDSRTRYLFTEWVVASMFNLDYVSGPVDNATFLDFLFNPEKVDAKTYARLKKVDFADLTQMMKNNYLTGFLKERGYKIVVCEGSYIDKINNADIDIRPEEINQSEVNISSSDVFFTALYRKTIVSPFNQFFKIDQTYNAKYFAIKYVFNYLSTEVQQIRSPKFIYAHLMLPHSPFVFDREGNYVEPVNTYPDNIMTYRPPVNTVNGPYLDQYIYASNQVKKMVGSIIHRSGAVPPVIIIQSDHGPRPHEVYLKDKTTAFSVFNAVYFPDGDYRNMYGNISTVNTFRVVLNKYFGENYKMLEDK